MDGHLGEFGPYLRFLADEMGLRDWTVQLECGPLENAEHVAEIQRIYGRKHARIRVSPEFWTEHPERQAQTLIHELLHCHFAGVQDAGVILGGVLHRKAYAAWHPPFEHQVEYAVDALAGVLARLLPPLTQGTEESPADR